VNEPAPKKSQVQIESEDLDLAKATVDKILLMALHKFDLYDNSHTSRVPDTIRSVVESSSFGFGLGARVVKGLIVVGFNPIRNYSQKFKDVRDFILNELRNSFHIDPREISEDSPDYIKTY
jgi:hypothetical protein